MAGQDRHQLCSHLNEQRAFLRASAAAFDRGEVAEAKRLALTVRVLVHDTGKSTSLLKALGVKDRLRYVSSTAGVADGAIAGVSLVSIALGPAGFAYVPSLDFSPDWPKVSFGDWWNMAVMKTVSGDVFTRRDFVWDLANTDGGGHVGDLRRKYQGLSRTNSMGWRVSVGGTEHPPPGSPVPVGVRQIAQELMWTLDHGLASALFM